MNHLKVIDQVFLIYIIVTPPLPRPSPLKLQTQTNMNVIISKGPDDTNGFKLVRRNSVPE